MTGCKFTRHEWQIRKIERYTHRSLPPFVISLKCNQGRVHQAFGPTQRDAEKTLRAQEGSHR